MKKKVEGRAGWAESGEFVGFGRSLLGILLLGKDLLKVTLHKVVGGGRILETIGAVAIFVQEIVVIAQFTLFMIFVEGKEIEASVTSLLFVRFTAADWNGDWVGYSVRSSIAPQIW